MRDGRKVEQKEKRARVLMMGRKRCLGWVTREYSDCSPRLLQQRPASRISIIFLFCRPCPRCPIRSTMNYTVSLPCVGGRHSYAYLYSHYCLTTSGSRMDSDRATSRRRWQVGVHSIKTSIALRAREHRKGSLIRSPRSWGSTTPTSLALAVFPRGHR